MFKNVIKKTLNKKTFSLALYEDSDQFLEFIWTKNKNRNALCVLVKYIKYHCLKKLKMSKFLVPILLKFIKTYGHNIGNTI